MDGRWMIGAGAALVACVTGGTLAGTMAGQSVEGFYTALPAPRYQPVGVAMPPSSPADWDQAPIAAAAPAPAPGWASAASASERAFFDTGAESRAYEADLRLTREERDLLGLDARGRPLPVRIHRPAVRQAVFEDASDKVTPDADQPKEPVEEAAPPTDAPSDITS